MPPATVTPPATATRTPGILTATTTPGVASATPVPTQTPGGPTATPGAPTAPPGLSTATPGAPTATPGGPSATPHAPTATPTVCAITFGDVHPADYFAAPVGYLACRAVISGYEDGTFRPYANTTRAQLVKIVVLGFGLSLTPPAAGTYTFADVLPGFPFFAVIETAAAQVSVGGYTCGGPGKPCDAARRAYFRPYANVTRGQLSKIAVSAAGWTLQTPPAPTFADVAPGSAFYPFVETAVCHAIVSGYRCGAPGEPCTGQNPLYFRQASPATRGQIAKIVYLALTGAPGCSVPQPGASSAPRTVQQTRGGDHPGR